MVLLSFSFIFLTSCNNVERGPVNNTEGQSKPFASSGEAVLQGKKDLAELLKARTDLNLDVDAAQVEKSQPDQGMEMFEVDFQKLLQAEPTAGLDKIANASKQNATPLSVDNQVIGIINTRQDGDGWKISGISNPIIRKDLNEIRKARAEYKGTKINYFDVPNIDARVYSVSVDGQDRYLTNYDGFSFEKPVSIAELLPRLKEDALVFEKLYGERLRKEKLVK